MTTQDKQVEKLQGRKLPPLTIPIGDWATEISVEWLMAMLERQIEGRIGVRTGRQLPTNRSEAHRRGLNIAAYIAGAPIPCPDVGEELAPFLTQAREAYLKSKPMLLPSKTDIESYQAYLESEAAKEDAASDNGTGD